MMMGPGMMGGLLGGNFGIVGMILNFLFLALIIVGIIVLIVWLVKRTSPSGARQISKNSAVGILEERYSRGEITKGEFDDIKKDIS